MESRDSTDSDQSTSEDYLIKTFWNPVKVLSHSDERYSGNSVAHTAFNCEITALRSVFQSTKDFLDKKSQSLARNSGYNN